MAFRSLTLGSALAALLLVFLVLMPHSAVAADCVSDDSPNPIAQEYPYMATGTLNGTTLIVPIAMSQARELIPREYAILESAYRSLLPTFPEDMYPMVVTVVHDHDIQLAALGIKVPDFSRAVLEFPFLDIFGDGHSCFRWAATMMMTANNLAAITGSRGYGINVLPAQFDPPCDAYKSVGDHFTIEAGTVNATTTADSRHLGVMMQACHDEPPYPMGFIKNITNQPTFANAGQCDNYVRLYNTSNTSPPHDPIPVRGMVATNLEPLKGENVWRDVYGWVFATAFKEAPMPASCNSLRGFVDS